MGLLKTGIIVCTRVGSSRIKEKSLHKINDIPIIEHLVRRLIKIDLPVFIACPDDDYKHYAFLKQKYPELNMFTGYADNPLMRMKECARVNDLEAVVRVCHDKIFVDPTLLSFFLVAFNCAKLDYIFSSEFTAGTGFEIMTYDALEKASKEFGKVEHISYAIKAVTENFVDYPTPVEYKSDHRLLIDYPEDLRVISHVMTSLGSDCTLKDVLNYMNFNARLGRLNKMPVLTIYTCFYNASKYLKECIASVVSQNMFKFSEYILVDDCSTDNSYKLAKELTKDYQNIKIISNKENLGLASSSNVALLEARGKYITRLDADDYYSCNMSLTELVEKITYSGTDAVYSACFKGDDGHIDLPNNNHHIGGAIFKTRVINEIKFMDGLRGYEGYEFFKRAKDKVKIGYLMKPIFCYRQHGESLTKNNLKERKLLKDSINAQMAYD